LQSTTGRLFYSNIDFYADNGFPENRNRYFTDANGIMENQDRVFANEDDMSEN
jgi:hypothetical protein